MIFACGLLVAAHAQGADPLACETTVGEPIDVQASMAEIVLDDPRTLVFEAGRLEAQLGDDASAIMSDGVLLRQSDKLAGADTARFDTQQRAMYLEGNVRFEDARTKVISDSAQFAYESGQIRFDGAEFSLTESASRGAADVLEVNQSGELILEGVEYTTCPPGSEDWLLQGSEIKLDTVEGSGKAKGVKLRFKGVPILYTPYLSFPLGDARKSGILTPEFGSAGRSGNEIRVPFYWNMAPNYDATITMRQLTDRGLQLGTVFRYLTRRSLGTISGDWLPDDDILNETRHHVRFEHRTLFNNRWRNRINFREVSDSQYFEDLGGSLSVSSLTHLDRNLSFDYFSDRVSLLARVQDYQTIDDAIAPDDEPYQRLPQLLASAAWSRSFLHLGIDGEIVNFDRDVGVTGWRLNVAPSVEIPISKPGWFITPSVSLDHTRYDLDNTAPGLETEPARTVPIASLDTGMVLERLMQNSSRVQTIEPRLLYVNIPFKYQDDLPVFDTIEPDINLVQLFRKNRFLGVDRIGDTEQVSVGITSRILDVSSGRELMTATVGQTRYFGDRDVTLPGMSADTLDESDYIAQVRFLVWENINFDFGHQWAPGDEGTAKSEARLQYRPAGNKILNLAYRFRRDSLEQGDLSWSWPVSTQWNFVGRYNFSFRDEEVLEQFFGLEYESCCWGLRLVSRKHISTRDGTRDSSFGLQLVLKGMASVGTAADKLLERGILGYSADLR